MHVHRPGAAGAHIHRRLASRRPRPAPATAAQRPVDAPKHEGMDERTHFRTCPLWRGDLRSRDHDARPRGHRHPRRRRRRRLSRGYICPKGSALAGAATPIRTACARRWSARGSTLARGRLGRGVRRDRSPPAADPRASTAATRSPSTWATRPRTTSALDALPARARCARSARATSTRRAPSTRCRSRSRPGSCSARRSACPVPDVDRTDYLAHPRRRTRSSRTAA